MFDDYRTPHYNIQSRYVHHRKVEITPRGATPYLYCTAVFAVCTPSAHVKMLSLADDIQQLLYIMVVPSWQLFLRPSVTLACIGSKDVQQSSKKKYNTWLVNRYMYYVVIYIGSRYIYQNIYIIYYCTDENKKVSALCQVRTINVLCMIFVTCCVHHNIIYLCELFLLCWSIIESLESGR